MPAAKISKDIEERLVKALEVGASFKIACKYAGITFRTFLNWKKKAKEYEEGNKKYLDYFIEAFGYQES